MHHGEVVTGNNVPKVDSIRDTVQICIYSCEVGCYRPQEYVGKRLGRLSGNYSL